MDCTVHSAGDGVVVVGGIGVGDVEGFGVGVGEVDYEAC